MVVSRILGFGSQPSASIVRVKRPDEIESLAWRIEAQRLPVTRGERFADLLLAPAAHADQRKAANHRTDLMVQERTRRGADVHFLANAFDAEQVERLFRALGLAVHRPERGEVMAPDECLGRTVHRFGIEWPGHLPGAIGIERQRRAAVGDAVEVLAAHAGKPGVPIVGHHDAIEHRDRIGAQVMVERFHQPEGLDRFLHIDVDPRNIESERARNAAARETAAKEAENAAELSAIQADPDAYLAENGNPRPGESPQQFSWRTNLAQEMSSDKFHTQQAEIADALSQPGVTPDQLDSILQGQRPSVAAKWRAAYDEMQDAKIQAFRATPEYINPTWAKADEMIQRFDRNAPDWREQVTEIRKLVMTLPVGWRQYLPDLDSKIAAKPPEPAAALQNEIGDSIDNMFKQGGFGPVEQDITLGKPFDSDTYEKVKPGVSYEKTKPGKEPLPEAQLAGPRSAKTALKLRMLALMKAHPEWNNDPQKAWDELNNSGKRVHRGSAPAVNFGPSAPVPPEPDPIPQAQPAAILQDGVPYDMPNNPQAPGPSSLLLPTGQQSMWVADAKNGTTEVTPMTADDVKNWQDAGEKTVKVWDISGNKWVNIPPGELKPGRHAKPSSLFPPP